MGRKRRAVCKATRKQPGCSLFPTGGVPWSEMVAELGCFYRAFPRCSLRFPSSLTQEDPVFTSKLGPIWVELLQWLF